MQSRSAEEISLTADICNVFAPSMHACTALLRALECIFQTYADAKRSGIDGTSSGGGGGELSSRASSGGTSSKKPKVTSTAEVEPCVWGFDGRPTCKVVGSSAVFDPAHPMAASGRPRSVGVRPIGSQWSQLGLQHTWHKLARNAPPVTLLLHPATSHTPLPGLPIPAALTPGSPAPRARRAASASGRRAAAR